jgi:superfamily II DNA helicase RecQ
VVLSSHEAYKDANKLRPVLLSEKLKHKCHVTITDEAHTIKLWGQSGLRKDFLRIGDMHVFMPNPENAPMCAATATCSPRLREEIVEALKIKPNYYSMNLGCWQRNPHFSRFVMQGGQTSYARP